MIVEPLRTTKPAPLLMRLRALAAAPSRTPARLMVAGVIGVLALSVFFMSGTFTAINFIDSAAIAAEQQRAAVALELVLADDAAMPDANATQRFIDDFGLNEARIAAPDALAPREVAIAIPGTDSVLAWMPRRFASEAFESVAPMRLGFGALVVACIGFVMLRLHEVAKDLEARRVLAQELASRDALTGLKNRLTFDQELREAFAETMVPEEPLALFYLDLDAFKSVNDTLGHLAGDQLLRMAGERLIAVVDENDSVARLGGDEFAVLRHGSASRAELIALAIKIRVALSAPFPLDGKLATIGVSIGIAVAPAMAKTAEALVRAADVALYRAKAEGVAHYAFAVGEVRQSPRGERSAA